MYPNEYLTLIKPTIAYTSAYLAMVEAFLQVGEEYPYNNIELAREDFAQFVHELEDEAQGSGLPPGIPPQQTYLLLKDGQTALGEIRFRPHLSPPYEKHRGHIGYNIRPDQRGRGYATAQLALLLEEARKIQLAGVSLTIEGKAAASPSPLGVGEAASVLASRHGIPYSAIIMVWKQSGPSIQPQPIR